MSGAADIAYSAIPVIAGLSEPTRSQVRQAFADSIAVIWQVMIGISGAGLLGSLLMKAVPMHKKVDKKWALSDKTAVDLNPVAEAEKDGDAV